jgi:hypothetical protein
VCGKKAVSNRSHIPKTIEWTKFRFTQKAFDLPSQLMLAKERWSFAGNRAVGAFVITTLLTAATTFSVLYNFPNEIFAIFQGAFLIATPVLWCAALIVRKPFWSVILKVHVAIGTVFLVPDAIEPPNHQYHMAASALVVARAILLIIVAVDLLVTLKGRRVGEPKLVYLGLTVSALGGLYLGVLAWSPTLPPRVIAAAETAAEGRPYCIIVDGRPARSAADLTGWNMRAHHEGGWRLNFHALLATKAGTDFSYFNWSYRTGSFEPVTEQARFKLALFDHLVRCKLEPHLARDWYHSS